MQIWAALLRFVSSPLAVPVRAARAIAGDLLYQVTRVTLSDAIGAAVAALAMWVLVWRARWGILHSEYLSSPICPECGSPLHRVHRHTRDRLITWIVPLRRYRCVDPDCRWTGLRA